jgi:hypothetical protein
MRNKTSQRLKFIQAIFCATILLFISTKSSWAIDVITMNESESKELDKRSEHKIEVVKRSLELTIPDYGPFEFITLKNSMNRNRALPEIIRGNNINIYVAAATKEWDEKTIAIKIPIRRGLLNYRLLLIHKDELANFAKVETIDDLKNFSAGLRNGWVTADIFEKAGLKILRMQNFEGLFPLLNIHRFDYIPRGSYEIFDELEARKHFLENVVIEPTLAIHLPMPTYVYVSPKTPRIAERIEKGLNIMLANGELEAILNKYYADDIRRAKLNTRRIIKIENPDYDDSALLNDKTLWHQMD